MSENRQDGWYFIKEYSDSGWEVARWTDGDEQGWYLSGSIGLMSDKQLFSIGPRIPSPDEAPAAQPAHVAAKAEENMSDTVQPAPLSPERPASLKGMEAWLGMDAFSSPHLIDLVNYALKLERERLPMERRREMAVLLGEEANYIQFREAETAARLRAIAKELRGE